MIDISVDSDFPIENIPFGIISTTNNNARRCASAIGTSAIDLTILATLNVFQECPTLSDDKAFKVFSQDSLNAFMALGKETWSFVRKTLQLLISQNSPLLSTALQPLSTTTLHLPAKIGDYTDFYASKQHASNVGTIFRGKDNALPPNWVHIPIGYHGRASSVVVSGTPIRRLGFFIGDLLSRPRGIIIDPESKLPTFSVCRKLDVELEVAFLVGTPNEMGTRIGVDDALDHIFGMVLMNDWSARDIQQFEYMPLGPFLGKNFGTSISPWVVTMEALEPFRVAQPVQEPVPQDYLVARSTNNAYDVNLALTLKNLGSSTQLCTSNLKYMYWSFIQMLAHHSINGCPMNTGDLLGSGTISGNEKGNYGSMLEMNWNGTEKIMLKDGSVRNFLEDGDEVVITANCQGFVDGKRVRIGFGECAGLILPASPM